MQTDILKNSIQLHASQCVKCGLCLPHCPTYVITENECESPRGRIALLDALSKQQIPLSDKTRLYLDHCLTCRACEAVCPAKVSYGELIDEGRELIAQTTVNQQTTHLPKILNFALKYTSSWRLLAYLLRFYQHSGLQYLMRKSGLLKIMGLQRAEALLSAPVSTAQWLPFNSAYKTSTRQVALFTGCINQLVDRATLTAAIKVLTACGINVHIPAAQQCCGALHQHAGLNKQAQSFADLNVKVFNQLPITEIITITTGCAAVLQEYQQAEFAKRIIDINQFLITMPWPEQVKLKPLKKRVLVHTPCTLRNVLKQPYAPLQLLQKIPDVEIIPLATNTLCCGAAGQYMLQHPAMADELLNQTLQQIVPLNPDYVVTANIGCALHLQKGLAEKRLKTSVLHPITLIAKQLLL